MVFWVSIHLSLCSYVTDTFIHVLLCIFIFYLCMGITSCVSVCLSISSFTIFVLLYGWCNLLCLHPFSFSPISLVVIFILCYLFFHSGWKLNGTTAIFSIRLTFIWYHPWVFVIICRICYYFFGLNLSCGYKPSILTYFFNWWTIFAILRLLFKIVYLFLYHPI